MTTPFDNLKTQLREKGWMHPGTAFHVEPDCPVRLASKKGQGK